jgi:hypothetical protein
VAGAPRQQRRAHEKRVLRRYHAALGQPDYGYDDLLADYRIGIADWSLVPLNIPAGALLAALASKAPLGDLWSSWKRRVAAKEQPVSYLLLAEKSFLQPLEAHPWERRGLFD